MKLLILLFLVPIYALGETPLPTPEVVEVVSVSFLDNLEVWLSSIVGWPSLGVVGLAIVEFGLRIFKTKIVNIQCNYGGIASGRNNWRNTKTFAV